MYAVGKLWGVVPNLFVPHMDTQFLEKRTTSGSTDIPNYGTGEIRHMLVMGWGGESLAMMERSLLWNGCNLYSFLTVGCSLNDRYKPWRGLRGNFLCVCAAKPLGIT
ncbi:hypothetical protein BJX63DRAFT_394915 [Aspergillus granulosus]|uniref:Uncharacterized protein n=1 Tax=Aspergillus granulosus TaxID=176169 RepID=A0ABR4HCA1_9EURO